MWKEYQYIYKCEIKPLLNSNKKVMWKEFQYIYTCEKNSNIYIYIYIEMQIKLLENLHLTKKKKKTIPKANIWAKHIIWYVKRKTENKKWDMG